MEHIGFVTITKCANTLVLKKIVTKNTFTTTTLHISQDVQVLDKDQI